MSTIVPQAFASDGHFGYIRGYVYDTETDPHTLSMTLQNCSGDLLHFDFSETSDLADWSEKVMDYMYDNQFLNIGATDDQVVEVMATMGGDCSILDILEVYEEADDLPDDTVLAPPPVFEVDIEFEDEVVEAVPTLYEVGVTPRIRHHSLERVERPKGDNMRIKLKEELKRLKGDKKLTKRQIRNFKKRVKKSTMLRNPDDNLLELKEDSGLEHINPVRLRNLKDEGADATHPIQMRGLYKAKENHHVLVNANLYVLAELDLQGKDYSDFVGKKVLVNGEAVRSEKTIKVDGMRLLPQGDSENNAPLNKWKAGISLYKDIDTTDESVWYTEYLDLLYDRGILSGYETGEFGGANPVTIGEIAKIVTEAAMHELDEDEDFAALSDKQKRHWAKRYLRHMKRYRLLDDVINPDRPATRAEVIRAVLKAYLVEVDAGETLEDIFPDTDDELIRKAYKLGIISGYPDGTFKPNGQINRAEIAKIITRAIEVLEEQDETLDEVDTMFEELEEMSDLELEDWLYDSAGDDA